MRTALALGIALALGCLIWVAAYLAARRGGPR